MCLAIPGRVEEIDYPFALVSFGGAKKKIRIDLLDSVEVGEYILAHAGLAIQKVSEEEVMEINRLWKQILEE
jgi:hydrogenase expression/formation protein HypC